MYVGTCHTHTHTCTHHPCIYLSSSSSSPPRLLLASSSPPLRFVLGADCERYGHGGGVVPAAGAERVALRDDGYVEGRRPYAGGEGEGGLSETVPLLEAAAGGGSTGRDETSAEEVDDADVSEGGCTAVWARRGAVWAVLHPSCRRITWRLPSVPLFTAHGFLPPSSCLPSDVSTCLPSCLPSCLPALSDPPPPCVDVGTKTASQRSGRR